MGNSLRFRQKLREIEDLFLFIFDCSSPAGVVARQIKERVVAKVHPEQLVRLWRRAEGCLNASSDGR